MNSWEVSENDIIIQEFRNAHNLHLEYRAWVAKYLPGIGEWNWHLLIRPHKGDPDPDKKDLARMATKAFKGVVDREHARQLKELQGEGDP